MILTRDGKEITAIYKQDGTEIEEVKDANGRIVYSASREITGTLPLYFSGRGKPLTDYLISGDTLQNGTPSPEAPVDVVGCGTRTGNLLSEKYENRSINGSGAFTIDSNYDLWIGEVVAGQTYAISNMDYVYGFFTTKPLPNTGATYDGSRGYEISGTAVVTIPSGCTWIAVRVLHSADDAMLNLGSTALPYEPYGYTLPPTVNGTEYPIYLGQVQTTRRVKKLVLTGEEVTWGNYVNGRARFVVSPHDIRYTLSSRFVISDRYNNTYDVPQLNNNSIENAIAAYDRRIYIYTNGDYDIDTYKSYLAAQYAAGTPVTIWYVLAEPETGIVNEPLMKIGDYADTISFAQAGATIPTVSGANILDMSSPIKPSEVYIRGNIKPTGYGQLVDKDGVSILDKSGNTILVHGQ